MSTDDTLYEQLGGREAIGAVVDRFYERVLDDERLEPYFDETDTQQLRRHQTQFLTASLGGPNEYAGESVRKAHDHLDIRQEHFNAVAAHLQATLEEFNVEDEVIEEVMAIVGELEEDVVGR